MPEIPAVSIDKPNLEAEAAIIAQQKAFLHTAGLPNEADVGKTDACSGRTVKIISEVPVTEQLNLEGADADHLRKHTLDLNSVDIQIAKNTKADQLTYSDGFLIKNAWLTIADKSNATGAELAIGNNARFRTG